MYIPRTWRRGWAGDINMDSTGILVVIGTVGVNEIKLHRNMEGTEKVAV